MSSTVLSLADRRELFVDDYLIAALSGAVRLQLHRPVRRDLVFRTDAPWEGNACCYQTVFHDGSRYRLYYHGLHYLNCGPAAQALPNHPAFMCVAESDDGVTWERPELGLVEFNGSRANNILLLEDGDTGCDPAHTAVILDTNPACPAEQRFKAIAVGHNPTGLYVLGSADGYRFTLLSDQPAVTIGAFDSQNFLFWDEVLGQYREYHRQFSEAGVRGIMTASSPDPLRFPDPEWLQYPEWQEDQLYTNAIVPYFRAPHLLMGFPMRYVDRGWSTPILELPGLDERLARAEGHPRYGTAVTDGVFMTSRDGLNFNRWGEAFIRPGPQSVHSWVYGDNFTFRGMVQTPSDLVGAPDEISLYTIECYWEGPWNEVRRHSLRLDGFVSVNAERRGGELLTRPLQFAGGNLALNFETSAAGSIRVEVQDPAGVPVPGYTLDDCPPLLGDHIRHIVRWQDRGGDLRALEGQPIRLRIVLRDADLYSLQFVPYAPEPEYPVPPSPEWQGTDHP